MNREVMNRSGHQHGRGEALLGVWLALFPEKYICTFVPLFFSPYRLSLFLSRRATTYPLSISCAISVVGEIENIQSSIPIHIKASEIHPLIQAYVGIHVGTRHQKLTAYMVSTRSQYSSCFSLFIPLLFLDTWRVPRACRISHHFLPKPPSKQN